MRPQSALDTERSLQPRSRPHARALTGKAHPCPEAHRARAVGALAGAAARPAAPIGDGLTTRDRVRYERFAVLAEHDSAALYTRATCPKEAAPRGRRGAF